jgi:TrmH family RNA methyltransferase
VAEANHQEVFDWLVRNQLSVFTAMPEGDVLYTSANLRQPCAIVLGSEAQGIPVDWKRTYAVSVRLPLTGRADCLNVSTAAAVLFYEALRQRIAG